MKILDPGHRYLLDIYDGTGQQPLIFMKREGARYPNNVGTHAGTNCQEVLRALIDRGGYINNQIPCAETTAAVEALRMALVLFELRAARLHGRVLAWTKYSPQYIEDLYTCPKCGHVECNQHLKGGDK